MFPGKAHARLLGNTEEGSLDPFPFSVSRIQIPTQPRCLTSFSEFPFVLVTTVAPVCFELGGLGRGAGVGAPQLCDLHGPAPALLSLETASFDCYY